MKILLALLLSCLAYHVDAQSYNLVLQTDFDGQVVSGSKDQLISDLRTGKPVRVGWQLDFDNDGNPDLEHWVDATFITILEGEVFTQVDPIYAQGPNAEIPQVEIFPDDTKWMAIIGTNSKLLNRFIQNESDIHEIVFDDSINLTKEEKMEVIKQAELRTVAMKKVNTWKVTTFWSTMN